MIRYLLIAASFAFAMAATPVLADSNHGTNGGCQGNCSQGGGGNTYNQGGQGGNAYLHNSNHNTNVNANLNSNHNTNVNKNTLVNKNDLSNHNYNSQGQAQGQKQAQGQAQGQGQSQSVDGSGNSSVSIGGDEAAASSAAPVFLTTSNDTCMGSSGIGGQGMNFGFSIGTTWTDSNCIMLKNARELKVQGHEKAAKARLCMDADNAKAFELAGEPCPQSLKTAQDARADTIAYYRSIEAARPKDELASAQSLLPAVARVKEATTPVTFKRDDSVE